MKKSPLAQVKEQFGSKEKLVDALVGLPASILEGGDDKDALRKRLAAAANTKLLRLFAVGTAIEKRFGGKEQLVDGLLTLAKRSKDGDYRGKLLTLPLAKLHDMYRSLERRTKRAEKAAASA
mgnify:CR=1 FL=1